MSNTDIEASACGGIFLRSFFCVVGLLIFSRPLLAECIRDTMQALQICKTDQAIQSAQQQRSRIEELFRPANGRMSPESCQGFSDAYDKYKQLTQNYIEACQQKIDLAGASCEQDAAAAARGTPEDFRHFLNSLKDLKEAKGKLPNLQALIPPMENLKALVAKSCLKDLPGRVTNTNTDRGDANVGSIQTASENSSVGGSASLSPTDHYSSGGVGPGPGRVVVLAPAVARSKVDQSSNSDLRGSVADGRSLARASTSSAAQNLRTGATISGPSVELAAVSGQGRSGVPSLPEARFRQPLDRRAPSSVVSQFANKHSNIFANIRRRYFVERSNLY